jgi:hypothetical protein
LVIDESRGRLIRTQCRFLNGPLMENFH